MKSNEKTKVFVGVSGGVDSSVSAALLQKEGYDVTGVFIRTWSPEFIECTWRDERRDAIRVCAHLEIPFLELDAEDAYKTAVADYMIAEYRAGRTPNPDVMCNREIKFGVFWNFAREHGADYIATGHYARNENGNLKCAPDESKDQSYFLWKLRADDLSHILFPIGHLPKTEVRKLAEKFGLPTASKKDSQGVCMLGDLDIKQFLTHYIEPVRGDVLDESGTVIGYHDSAVFLTLGERHGFTITKKTPEDERYYIVAKDTEKNTITVSHRSDLCEPAGQTQMVIAETNWISEVPEASKKYDCQIRYHGERIPCTLLLGNRASMSAEIIFEKPVLASAGQSIVIYDSDVCIGGGIITA